MALAVGGGASSLPLRAAFFSAVAVVDFHYFAGYGGHTTFILLYAAAAMILPPGPGRSGALRVIIAHQLGSPGVHKLRVGGRAWFRPETHMASLRFVLHDERAPGGDAKERCQRHALVEPTWVCQPWLIRLLLRWPTILAILAACACPAYRARDVCAQSSP